MNDIAVYLVEALKLKAVLAWPAAAMSRSMFLFSFFCSVASFSATSSPCAACAWSFKTVAVSFKTLFLIFPFYKVRIFRIHPCYNENTHT